VAVVAADDPAAQHGVRRTFHRLLGEHLGLTAEEVSRGVDAAGSTIAFIDTRAGSDHTLVRIAMESEEDAELPEIVRQAADPDEPVQLAPATGAPLAGSALFPMWTFAGVVVFGGAIALYGVGLLLRRAVIDRSFQTGAVAIVAAAAIALAALFFRRMWVARSSFHKHRRAAEYG
jgi:hypothetical protein